MKTALYVLVSLVASACMGAGSEADEPAAAEPAATEPAAAEPAATEPAAAEPAATEPVAAEPATEPAATEPAATELAAPELAALEPAAATSDPTTAATAQLAPGRQGLALRAPSRAGEACRSLMARQRACSATFIPALVAARVTADNPPGVAARDRQMGREALLREAFEEWTLDSRDVAIDALCQELEQSIAPAREAELVTRVSACLEHVGCDELAACAVPLSLVRWTS